MHILVTGGTGFIGSSFINHIFKCNKYKIVALDNLSSCSSDSLIDKNIRESSNYVFIKGSYGDESLVKDILREHKITYVLNLAAITYQSKTLGKPVPYVDNNVLDFTKFLKVCHEYGKLTVFLHMSTFLVNNVLDSLATVNKICIDEYSVTKECGLALAILYRDVYKMPIILCLSNNIFGKLQFGSGMVPNYLSCLDNNKKIPVHINAVKKANYIYIDNVVSALEIILDKGAVGQTYKIINDKDGCYSDLDLARALVKYRKRTYNYTKWIEYINDRPCLKEDCPTDNSELKKLGWKLSVSTKTGLKIMAKYYKCK